MTETLLLLGGIVVGALIAIVAAHVAGPRRHRELAPRVASTTQARRWEAPVSSPRRPRRPRPLRLNEHGELEGGDE